LGLGNISDRTTTQLGHVSCRQPTNIAKTQTNVSGGRALPRPIGSATFSYKWRGLGLMRQRVMSVRPNPPMLRVLPRAAKVPAQVSNLLPANSLAASDRPLIHNTEAVTSEVTRGAMVQLNISLWQRAGAAALLKLVE
jgi:hypothetical protein